jgi:hypothetical protein
MPLPLIPLAISAFNFVRNSWVGKAIGILLFLAGGWMLAKRSGRKAAEAKEAARKAEAVQDMKEIRDEVEGLPDDARRNELGRFVRRPK